MCKNFWSYLHAYLWAHLSKVMSGFKQKCTQDLTSFSGTVFHALSHGVICFVRSVSPRNHFLTSGNSLTANQKLLFRWFSKLTLRTKWLTPCERAWKTVPENGVSSCVHFCLRSLLLFERCARRCSVEYFKRVNFCGKWQRFKIHSERSSYSNLLYWWVSRLRP